MPSVQEEPRDEARAETASDFHEHHPLASAFDPQTPGGGGEGGSRHRRETAAGGRSKEGAQPEAVDALVLSWG